MRQWRKCSGVYGFGHPLGDGELTTKHPNPLLGGYLCRECVEELEQDSRRVAIRNGAIKEGRAAYVLGSPPEANPYHKARVAIGGDEKQWILMDLECQWDSGYAIAKREGR